MDFRKTAMTTMPSLPPAAARPPRVSALRARPAASDTKRSATRTNTKVRVLQLPSAPGAANAVRPRPGRQALLPTRLSTTSTFAWFPHSSANTPGSLRLLFLTAYYSGSDARAPFLVPLRAICAERRAMQRFRALSCRGALSCFAPERIRRMRRSGGETAKTASAQCRARRKSKRQARSSAAADDASPQRRSRAFGREFSWFGPKGQAEQAANAQFQPTNPRFLAAMKNQG